MRPSLAPLLCTPLFNVATHHWSTEAGLRDDDPLLLDNLRQGQPRGDSIPDHSNPDCGCQRAAHLQGSPCSETPRYRALLLGEEGSPGSIAWLLRPGSFVLSQGYGYRRVKETNAHRTHAEGLTPSGC